MQGISNMLSNMPTTAIEADSYFSDNRACRGSGRRHLDELARMVKAL